MKKISVSSFDIRKGHTLGEYRKFFAVPYDKGKLLSFREDELELMSKKRIYWEIIDEDGRKMYYAIPSRFKPFRPNNHNLPLYQNKKPFGVAMIIIGACFVSCVSSYYVGKAFKKQDFNDTVEEKPLDEMSKEFHKAKFSGLKNDEIFNKWSIAKVANVAMAETVYTCEDGDDPTPTLRDKLMTVGHGKSDTDIIGMFHVLVDVTNSFIQNKDNVLEESISYSTNVLAPKVGKRDYYYGNTDKVVTYDGVASSRTTIDWNEEKTSEMSKKEYMDKAGKNPSQPFLYTITEETVLTDKVFDENPETSEKHFGASYKKKIDNGYEISMDIHNVKGVNKYVKRMTYLSGKTPEYFKTIHLLFRTDKDFKLTYSEVNESYSMVMMPDTGSMRTKYYYDDEALTIPENPTPFDYSKYEF